jgi:hypothetical protein
MNRLISSSSSNGQTAAPALMGAPPSRPPPHTSTAWAAQPVAEAEQDDAIEVSRTHIYLPGGGSVRLRSPRLRAACRATGTTVAELRSPPSALEPPEGMPAAAAALMRASAQALWEERLERVLTSREEAIVAAKNKGKKAGSGGFFSVEPEAGAGGDGEKQAGGGADGDELARNPLVELAQAHQTKVLRRRQREEEAELARLRASYAEVSAVERREEEMLDGLAQRQHTAWERSCLSRSESAGGGLERGREMVRAVQRAQRRRRRQLQAEAESRQAAAAQRVERQAAAAREAREARQAAAERRRQHAKARDELQLETKREEALAVRERHAAQVAAARRREEARSEVDAAARAARASKISAQWDGEWPFPKDRSVSLSAVIVDWDLACCVLATKLRRGDGGSGIIIHTGMIYDLWRNITPQPTTRGGRRRTARARRRCGWRRRRGRGCWRRSARRGGASSRRGWRRRRRGSRRRGRTCRRWWRGGATRRAR